MPMPRRRLTSVALRTDDGGVYLFDCGEGTQVGYKEHHVGLRALRVICITHLHGDHLLGLPGLLMLRAQMDHPGPLTVLGPPGLGKFLRNLRRDLPMYINYEVQVQQWSRDADELAYEDEQVQLRWFPLDHGITCLGYRMDEHPRPGRFDPAAAAALGVPQGPLWGQLQQGQVVQGAGGAQVHPRQVLGPTRRGRRVAFVTDTAPCPNLERVLERADLALLEGMFHSEHEQDAADKKHMTVTQSCSAASRAQVAQVVLVHLSPRYGPDDVPRLAVEARQHHVNVRVGRDGELFSLPLPGDS